MILQSTSQRICPLLEQAQAGAMHAEIQPPSQRTEAACKSAKGEPDLPQEARDASGTEELSRDSADLTSKAA